LREVNWLFVLRALIIALALIALGLVGFALALPRLIPQPPLGTPPPPPPIDAASGPLPDRQVGLQEWVLCQGSAYRLAGSGFLLQLTPQSFVAVTTAHSVPLTSGDCVVEEIAFGLVGQDDFLVTATRLHGKPGGARILGLNLSVDYLFLEVPQRVDPALVLCADPRGGPQPGERVMLYNGQSEQGETDWMLEGSVVAADAQAAWIVMDRAFEPWLASGSPVLSSHTGCVVGMTIAAKLQAEQVYLGIHPIGSLMAKAQAADSFPLLADYGR
jgi:hypothetical protein